MNDEMRMGTSYEAGVMGDSLGRYTAKTFGWMFLGLLTTFIVAMAGYLSGAILYVAYVPSWPFVLLIAEVAVVMVLTARISKLSVGMARALFFLYAGLNGIVFSAYFLLFNMVDMVFIFGLTALFFGIMAAIGYFGNINFNALRPFMLGGLLFLCGFWLLSLFINLSAFETMVCAVGIFIFLLYTAYDAKKIQAYYSYYGQMPEMAAKASIFAALQLYLDFINLFVYLIRILARRDN